MWVEIAVLVALVWYFQNQ